MKEIILPCKQCQRDSSTSMLPLVVHCRLTDMCDQTAASPALTAGRLFCFLYNYDAESPRGRQFPFRQGRAWMNEGRCSGVEQGDGWGGRGGWSQVNGSEASSSLHHLLYMFIDGCYLQKRKKKKIKKKEKKMEDNQSSWRVLFPFSKQIISAHNFISECWFKLFWFHQGPID